MNDDKIKKILGEPIANLCQSYLDKFIEANVENRHKLGMGAVIIRQMVSNCCNWCKGLVGIYEYGTEPKNVYRRHDNCKCLVTYKSYKGGYKDVHSKQEFDKYSDALEARFKLKNKWDYHYRALLKSGKNDKINDRFRSTDDPMFEKTGRAIDSNPEEVAEILRQLEEWGVEINISNAIGYGASRRGARGSISISRDASYSALLHEFQHVKDAMENGWDAAEVLFTNPLERIRREIRAYNVEIKHAKSLGYDDVAKKLERLLENEIERIKRENNWAF